MIKLFPGGVVDSSRIETFDMLPRIARLAVYRIPVIVGVVADALDGVGFFVHRFYDGMRIVDGDGGRMEGGLNRGRDLRGYREEPFCHNLVRSLGRAVQGAKGYGAEKEVHVFRGLGRMTKTTATVERTRCAPRQVERIDPSATGHSLSGRREADDGNGWEVERREQHVRQIDENQRRRRRKRQSVAQLETATLIRDALESRR